MRKTSVYLEPADLARLARLAEQERISQAEVIRRAIASYVPRVRRDRDLLILGTGQGDGRSVLDVPEEELLAGFGS